MSVEGGLVVIRAEGEGVVATEDRWSVVLMLALLSVADAGGKRKAEAPDLEDTAAMLLGRALSSDEAWDELRQLCDGIGHRISGSAALDRALAWGAERMAEDGLVVRTEPVTIPVWRRNEERDRGAFSRDLAALAVTGWWLAEVEEPPGRPSAR